MITRYAHSDEYTYSNSSVLRNKAGHRNEKALEQFERLSVANRMMEDPPAGDFDYTHLKAMHFHLFQDVYDWAGEERKVSISKGATQFCQPRFIEHHITQLLNELAAESHLQHALPEHFVLRAAHFAVELNMTHPFREGNGRAIRQFITQLAENAGYELDMELLQKEWVNACIEGVSNSEAPMQHLLANALIVFED